MVIMTAEQYAVVHKVRYPEDKPIDIERAYKRYKQIAADTRQFFEAAAPGMDEGPEDPEQVLPSIY